MYTSLDDFITDLPRHVQAHQAALRTTELTAVLQTRQGRKLTVQLKDGQVSFPAEEVRADCTVTADEQALLDMINGKLNPMKAVLLRKIVIQGDAAKLLALIRLV